ncbi:hypothetical protein [Roseateles oligotrophus]|uniref:Uncharacterized protein n=1 Tax=Roseateles oligotrophus TaxID=1769250 RepID=A0ABT2YF67_9BURK|nr:hypothetical protein [Roseateles oligotrophus]MCV2368687.1 hypothetical protein [Roseateles oligotrophus]
MKFSGSIVNIRSRPRVRGIRSAAQAEDPVAAQSLPIERLRGLTRLNAAS